MTDKKKLPVTVEYIFPVLGSTVEEERILWKVDKEFDPDNPHYENVINMTEIAYDVRPISITEDIDSNEISIEYHYICSDGYQKQGIFDPGCLGDTSAQRKEISKMAKSGVRVANLPRPYVAEAFLAWLRNTETQQKKSKYTGQVGFIQYQDETLYVLNKDTVIGDTKNNWIINENSDAVKLRSNRKGTVESWVKSISKLCTTEGLLASLGTSLAGPVVSMLGVQGFGLHFVGASSTGKSTGLILAASVWGLPDVVSGDSVVRTWDTTPTEMDNHCRRMNGACLFLDELGTFKGYGGTVGEIIYSITGGQGRARAQVDGSSRKQSSWRLTMLSTGEISTKDRVGISYKGGQSVRVMDVYVEKGKMSRSATHARDILKAFLQDYGVFSEVWIRHLMLQGGLDSLRSKLRHYESFCDSKVSEKENELGRALASLSIVGASLEEFGSVLASIDSSVKGFSRSDIERMLTFLIIQIREERGEETDPYQRALRNLKDAVDTNTLNFPHVDDPERPGILWGYRKNDIVQAPVDPTALIPLVPEPEERTFIYVNPSTLKASGLLSGYTPRKFLEEGVKRGDFERIADRRVGGAKTVQSRAWFRMEI